MEFSGFDWDRGNRTKWEKHGVSPHVFVAFALRRRGYSMLIRPVSARYMHRKEVAHYEKETSKTKE
jgi:uncharacterized DUF497 family protein